MVRFLKLLIVVLLLNALWRVGTAYWQFYQFRDAAEETAQFSSGKSEETVRDRVVEQGTALGIAIQPSAVRVHRNEQQHIFIDAAYMKPVEVIPRLVKRDWPFSFTIDVWTVAPIETSHSPK